MIEALRNHLADEGLLDNWREGLALSLVLHIAIFGGLFWLSYEGEDTRRLPPASINVGLAQRPNTSAGGKKSDAPTAGKVSKPKPTVTKEQPKPKAKPKPKPAKNEVGTKKKEDKPKPKKEPEPVAETASKTVEKPTPAPPKVTPPPEDDTRSAKARGGFGGEEDSGLSLELGNPDEPLTVLEDLEFQSYFENLMRQLQQRWSIGGMSGGIAIVRVQIGRDGSIQGADVVESAGKNFLDSAAKRAVLGMELPPLPQGYRGEKLIVNLRFNYRKDR